MTYSIRLPDGTLVENIPDEVTPEAAKAKLLSSRPELGAAPKPAPSKERTFGEAAADVGAGLVGGAGKLIQLPGQLYGLATGDFSETGSLGLGKKIEQAGEEMKSAGLKAREQERAEKIAEAEKKGQIYAFGTALGETLKDPGLLLNFLAEQAPQLLVPFGAGRVGSALTAGRAGTRAAIGAGAVQQGADIGAGSYEDIYKELIGKGVSEADAKQSALNLARASGASGAVISLLAQKLPGAKRLEEAMAGVPSKTGRVRGALGTAAGEALGEIPEEVGGKFTQNLAMREVKPEQELTAGLGETAAMAAIGGAGMGGAAGLARGRAKPEVKPEVTEVLEAKRAPEEPTKLEEEKVQPIAEATQVEAAQDIQAGKPAEPSPVVDTQVVNVDGKEATQTTRQDGSVEVDGVQIVPPKTETERETTQTTPTTEGEEDVARPNEPTSGTGVPVPVRAANELPAAEGIEGTEQRGVAGAGPTTTEPTGGAGVQPTPIDKRKLYKEPEPIKGEPMPLPTEVAEAEKNIEQLEKLRRKVETKEKGPSLFNKIRGTLSRQEMFELTDAPKNIFVAANSEKKGALLTDLVADGYFDDFLPFRNRAIVNGYENPNFDESSATEYIKDKIRNRNYLSYATEQEIKKLNGNAAQLGEIVSEHARIEEANALAQEATEEGRNEILESSEKSGGYNIDPQEQTIEKELAGKNFMQVAQWAVRSAPNAFAKVIAQKVLSRLQGMQARGVKFDFKVEAGNERSTKLRNARGITSFIFGKTGQDTTIKITLNGATVMDNQAGFPSGMNYVTVLHELLHAATRGQLKFMKSSDPLVKELIDLRNKVIKHFNDTDPKDMTPFMKRYYNRENNSLDNIDEMVSWGMTDEDMQKFLGEIKVGEKTGFSKLVETIRKILGLGQPYESALDRLVKTTESILDESIDVIGDGIESRGYSYGTKAGKKPLGQQQSLFSKKVQEIFGEEFGLEERKPTSTGQSSLDILDKYGRNVEKTTENRIEKFKETIKDAADNPEITLKNAQSAFTKFLNYLETKVFSSDAALNNDIRKSMGDLGQDAKTKIGMLLQTSLSQTVHSDAVANLFLRYGNIEYDNDLKKWVKKDSDANFVELSRKLDKMAEKNGFTKEQAEKIAHLAFEAKRTKSLIKFNQELQQKIDDIQAEATQKKAKSPVASSALSEKAARMKNEFKYIHLTDEEIADGMSLFKTHPELNEVVDAWNKIRDNASKVLIDSGLWSESDAEFLLSNSDYVPFYREDQLEQGKGPKEFIRGLQVQAKERKLKGSDRPVNDIFDNQVRWVQYSINRAVRNKSAVSLAEAAESVGAAKRIKNLDSKENIGVVGVDDNNKPILGKVSDGAEPFNSLQKANFANQQVEGFEVVEFEDDNKKTKYLLTPAVEKKNVVKVWRNGKQVEYSMEDPLYMEAFNGLESVAIPMFKLFSKFSDMLRQSVVMYPLFTISQIPQDSFAAIFSSGLKPQHALKIPILAVKEFIQTLRGKSAMHEELKNVGATGVRDFTSAMVRMDAEIFAGFKAPPGVLGKIKGALNHFAMAGDNAVRQAVYEASLAQGLSKAEAMEKAFDIFNARRKGSSKTLALASQVIPFFNAYLAAQNVAYKVITGRGVSPTQRADAYKTLAATTGSVMVLSLLYAMIASDDDDYLEKPVGQRDRAFIIPGTGGVMIPLRKDLFTMPKVIAEHTYLMLTDKGSEDGRKFRDSVAAGLMNSILGPTPVPQAIKPFAEVYLNYDFYQQRPLIGTYQKKLDTERQFNESTSELSKLLGQTGLISPIVADHLVRGLFGSVGGLVLYATNPFLYSGASGERPSMSFQDAIATLPGTSGFVSREYENAMKRDFYVLKDEVDKAANTFADLKTRSPQEIEEFLKDEKNVARVGMSKSVNKIADQLSKLRKYMEQVRNSDMPADEKRDRIKELKESESNMMKNIDVKALREMGKI